jgi:hypothetical protein
VALVAARLVAMLVAGLKMMMHIGMKFYEVQRTEHMIAA